MAAGRSGRSHDGCPGGEVMGVRARVGAVDVSLPRGCGEVTHPGGSAGLETGSRTLVSGDGAETCNPWMRSPRKGRRRGPWPSPGVRHQVDDGEGEVE